MGQHADDLLDWEYRKFHRPYDEFFDGPRREPKPKWTTLQGTTMLVEDMTTGHIINAINKQAREGKPIYKALSQELEKRNKE